MSKTKKIFFTAMETLKKDIIDGKYPFNSKLPSEAELSEKLHISVTTIRKILDALRNEGLIETQKGRGSFVINKAIHRHIPVIIYNKDFSFRSTELLQGIQDFFNEIGFISLPQFNDADTEKEKQIITSLIEKGHKNIIIYPLSSKSNSSFYQSVMRKGVNLTFVDTLPYDITCDYVSSCNFLGGYMATKKLIDLGHKNIAFCCYENPSNFNTINERFKGYLSALKQNGISKQAENILFNFQKNDNKYINNLIKTTKATAFFAANDEIAIALLNKFKLLSNPPAIIGFDNTTISESISLASINQQYYKIGKTAAELLYKRILEPNKNYEFVYVPVSVVERESLYLNKKY